MHSLHDHWDSAEQEHARSQELYSVLSGLLHNPEATGRYLRNRQPPQRPTPAPDGRAEETPEAGLRFRATDSLFGEIGLPPAMLAEMSDAQSG